MEPLKVSKSCSESPAEAIDDRCNLGRGSRRRTVRRRSIVVGGGQPQSSSAELVQKVGGVLRAVEHELHQLRVIRLIFGPFSGRRPARDAGVDGHHLKTAALRC